MDLHTKKQFVVRPVGDYEPAEVKRILLEGFNNPDMSFFYPEFGPETAADYSFDAATDGKTLYFAVCTHNRNRKGPDAVEILIDPLCDGIGCLQWGATSDGSIYENRHLPYRTPETEKFHSVRMKHRRDCRTDVLEELYSFDFFEIDRESFAGLNKIGFNVGISSDNENGSWNLSGGGGFPDPDSFGILWLRQPERSIHHAAMEEPGRITAEPLAGSALPDTLKGFDPCGKELGIWKRSGKTYLPPSGTFRPEESGIYRFETEDGQQIFLHFAADDFHPMIQGTHDFPDSWFNASYTKELLQEEFRRYAAKGLRRIYWLDYRMDFWTERFRTRVCAQENLQEFGPDMLDFACKAAHNAGLEFFVLFKPFDTCLTPLTEQAMRDCPLRLNPEYMPKLKGAVRTITLFSDRVETILPDGGSFRVLASENGTDFHEICVKTSFRKAERPDSIWFGGQTQQLSSSRCVSSVELKIYAASEKDRFFRIETDAPVMLRNRRFRLCEFADADGNVVIPFRGSIQDDAALFLPDTANAPSWNRIDTGMDMQENWIGRNFSAAFAVEWPETCPNQWEITCPDVQKTILDFVQRAIDVKADGFEFRLEHHKGCADNMVYMQAPTVVSEFKKRTGRGPQPDLEDFRLLRKIRGEAYSAVVREASRRLHAAGLKFHHHLGNRLLVAPGMDPYSQIDFDIRSWIREGLLDGVSLKYISAANEFAVREFFPLCRQNHMEINEIAAPVLYWNQALRLQAANAVRNCRAAGFNGFNLYELWLFSRVIDGVIVPRLQADKMLRTVRENI